MSGRLILAAALVAVLVLLIAAYPMGRQLYAVAVGFHSHDSVPPALPGGLADPAILVFSKTNGFRHEAAIPAAETALREIATGHGWSVFATENGAVFTPDLLARFKVVVWNNASGDVLNPAQRAAFRAWLESGGGFVGIHGAGGDLRYDWDWYVDTLIGAQFIGHTLDPQFQRATVRIADGDHPATRGLDGAWDQTDELYSFAASPREKGVRVLATLDEASYQPVARFPAPASWFLADQDLRMGDHPIVWSHCVGNGRALYSALGHPAEAYAGTNHRRLLEGALAWAAGLEGPACRDGKESGEDGQ